MSSGDPLEQQLHPLRPLRILALHGARQSASIFRERLDRLEQHLATRFHPPPVVVYAEGPVILPRADGDSVGLRDWFVRASETVAAADDNDPEPPVDAGDPPPRTPRTPRCPCRSLAHLDALWRRHGPFDGLLGFSAGAHLATLVAALPDRFPGVAFALLAGCPDVPTPPCDHLPWPRNPPLRTLHVFGAKDALVGWEESRAVAETFAGDTRRVVFVSGAPPGARVEEGGFDAADDDGPATFAHFHDQGHVFPVRAADLKLYASFLAHAAARPRAAQEAVQDELDSLAAIYGEDFGLLSPTATATGATPLGADVGWIRLPTTGTRWEGKEIRLGFRLGPGYPGAALGVAGTLVLVHGMGMLEMSSAVAAGVLRRVGEAAAAVKGDAAVFEAACTAQTALAEVEDGVAVDAAAEDSESEDSEAELGDAATLVTGGGGGASGPGAPRSKASRGPWRHTIGLVGKPSAGKSTFFNGATRTTLAKVAAHPFTTIDPNVGMGWWAVPDDMVPAAWKEAVRRSDHGRVLLPCLVKDVAGLVPGAWEGRGRGNQFLNDLCDADVLVHVVDASGMSDEDGNILQEDDVAGGPNGANPSNDPLHDIRWVRLELRNWILGNLLKKWDSVIKRPWRLPDMFSGYQAPRWLVDAALRKAGLDPSVERHVARSTWTHDAAGRAVDAFLEERFPILLALNKADLPSAERHVKRILAALKEPGSPAGGDPLASSGVVAAVPVCAAAELWLQDQARLERVKYIPGSTAAALAPGFSPGSLGKEAEEAWTREWGRAQHVLQHLDGTGVLRALTAAVMLRPPRVCHPVEDLEPLVPLHPVTQRVLATNAAAGASGAAATAVKELLPCAVLDAELGAYVAVKPGTTVGDLFSSLSAGSGAPLQGQFVRCEVAGREGGPRRVARKEEEVGVGGTAVVRLMSNRKSKWQM
ncbi:hypothetical protein HDU96_005435 [Phlyctochytrium bullatum]|nr:hypothetical protein HDU96_005435 [Phlyctochytrium bullatum]